MKRCPECRRDYYDDSLAYCLDDGTVLVDGPPSCEEAATALFSRPGSNAAEDAAKADGVARSIVVLPFANVSPDAENEYFCDGLAEELIIALSKLEKLKVVARSSAFAFKGKQAGAREIGRALNVNTVLDGSVRRSGDRLRIVVQLVNAADGYQLWSERYDREMKDIFDVQDEIAVSVVDVLKIKLLGGEKAALLKRHTQNPEAHEFYLRGLSHFSRWTPVDFEKAIENFERAIGIDPDYAVAHAALADAYTELLFFSFSSSDARSKARAAASKALQIDDSLAEAHNSHALIKMYLDWDYAAAEDEFKHALALNPGSATVRMWYGWYLAIMARFDEALRELQHARGLDPLAAPNINAIGVVFHWARQPERAIAQFQEVLDIYPNYTVTLSFLAEAYAQKGDMNSAIRTIEQIQPAALDPQALSIMGYLYAIAGEQNKAQQILRDFAELSKAEYVPALNIAQIYVGLGDHERALDSLATAYDERAIWMPFLKVDPKLDPLRDDPRFKELLGRTGFVV